MHPVLPLQPIRKPTLQHDTVRFTFTGNPYYLTFYSGEPYHRYEYRDRETAGAGSAIVFHLCIDNGVTGTNTLALMVSTDFSGVYDSTNIYNATWTDITSKATWAVQQYRHFLPATSICRITLTVSIRFI